MKRCFDLKGSTLDRNTSVDFYNQITGETGLKVLKDLNFQEMVDNGGKIDVPEDERRNLLQILREDSKLLEKHHLIDYSVFLLEIDR